MKQPKIVKLEIEEGLLAGVDAIAFVEQPAIEVDFLAFSKEEFETYNDYPQKAVENAKRGIELNKANDNKCATQVGKVRAQQLANGENLSLDTIRRMRAFLIRQKDNYELARDRKDYNACGYISYLLWGGAEALPWSEKKLRQAGEELSIDVEALPDYVNEVSGSIIEKMSATDTAIYENYLLEKFIEVEVEKDMWVDDLTDDIKDAVLDALLAVGKTEDDLVTEGYDFEKAVRLDAKESFVASVLQIKGASNEDEPSVDDFGQWHVLYRYMRYDGKESYGDNSRTFCKNVIKANKWFRKEDINKLTIIGANEGFGLNGQKFYDIFTYKGGKHCQHYWQAFQVPRKNLEDTSDRNKPSAILNRVVDATTLNPESLQNLINQQKLGRVTFSQEQLDEQQVVATPIMIPNKLITRADENGDKYYVYFSEETIKQIAYAFAQSKNIDKINLEHDMESMIDNIYLAESWIIDEPTNDKSNMFGYNLPKGSWFGLFKVNNDGFWKDYIKSGKVKGVSVEGYFINKLTKLV